MTSAFDDAPHGHVSRSPPPPSPPLFHNNATLAALAVKAHPSTTSVVFNPAEQVKIVVA
jgi:hypothetical protein